MKMILALMILFSAYFGSYILIASSDRVEHTLHKAGVSDHTLHIIYSPLADCLDRLFRP
jgi:hypothetical protein